MKKRILSTISLIMTVIMIILSLPVDALAYQLTHNSSSSIEFEELDLNTLTIEYEDETKRTQKEKHFKLSDGSYLAVQYNEPVHFLSEEGTWRDFDNTLSFEGAENTNDFTGYVNTEGDFKTKFTDKANSDILFKISDVNNENTISFELNESDVNAVFGSVFEDIEVFSSDDEVSEDGSILEQNKEILNLDKLSSQIDYEDVFEDVDFQYIVTTTGVKENIIVNGKRDNYDFSFIVNTGSLVAVQNEDGSISINSETETKYIIPAPFMYDDAGTHSDSVTYTLSMIDSGKYELCVDAAEEWINDSDRVFPVTIDPMVTTVTDGYAILYATSVSSGENADVNFVDAPMKSIGRNTTGEISRTYVNWTELPYLKAYDKIISAQLYYNQIGNENANIIIEAHSVSEEWTASTITWNGQPSFDSKVLDYTSTDISDGTGYLIWDITDIAYEWYETGSSNGIVLTSYDENVVGRAFFSKYSNNAEVEPYILVQYRCQNGLEDNYTYTTLEAGTSGNAYINNYTGTLTYVYDMFDSESSSMPIDLDLIYNSAVSNKRFSGMDYMNTCMYNDMDLGAGWKLSAQETIVPVEILEMGLLETEYDYAYIYCDRDGTEHYFYLDNAESETDAATEPVKYIDESGLGMTLVHNEDNNQYVITFSDESTKTFKIITETRHDGEYYENGYLISESDSKNNTITYTYDSTYPTRLVSITDPTGYTVNLGYDSSGYFNKVTAGERVITIGFEYGWGNRFENYKSVSDSYGSTTSFTYNVSLATISSADGAVTSFEYEPASYFNYCYRIKTASWRSGTAATANTAEFTYDRSHATTVHYYGNDCVNCVGTTSTDDIYMTYTFDKWGNTTLIYAEDYCRENVYSTSIYGYASGNTMNLNKANFNLTTYADTGVIGNNLIVGGSVEDMTAEINGTTGALSAITGAESYVGNKSIRCVVTNTNSNLDGVTKSIYLTPGEYCFSVNVKCVGGVTSELILAVNEADGTRIATSEGIKSTIEKANNGWQKLYLDFVVEESADYILYVGVEGGKGTFYADGFQLEEKTEFSPSSFNMVDNFGFETTGIWTLDNAIVTAEASEVKFGDKAVKVNGDMNTAASVSQTVTIGTLPKNSYILSGWAQADSVPVDGDRTFELFATVNYTYADINGVYLLDSVKTSIPFTWETDEWQYVSGVVELPENTDERTIVSIDSITVGASYDYNCNTAIFDNIALVQDSALKISYDENGNISSLKVDNEDTYEYIYDEDDKLIEIRDENGETVETYTYNENGALLSVKDKDNKEIESYTYDANGNMLTSVTEDSSSNYSYTAWGETTSSATTVTINGVQKTMVSESVYDSISRLLLSETDSLGNTTSYGYNADKWLTFIEDANGNQTRYNYSSGKLTNEYSDADKDGVLDEDEANIAYTYDTYGRLTGVTTATTEYVFAYNGANLLQSVAIAGETDPLISYRYNETYSANIGVTYANGLTIDYVYDILGNVTEVKRNGTVAIEYVYNGNMQVVCEEDHVNDSVTEYHYTDGGELYLTKKTQNGIEILEYSDTSVENTSKSITVINGYELDYTSIYDEETETSKFVLPTDAEITSDTDKFGRTEKVYLKDSDGNNILTITYTYVDKTIDGELRTSDRIQSITYSTNESYTYTYDAVGNITSVSDGPYITTYEYDELYQLTRENNQKAGKTWAYTYDKSGNILSKAEYAYTAKGVTLGTALDTVDYTYGNEDWGDQLTSYDGTAITYDAQGNPLNWREGMSFSWTGRQLDSITNSDGTVVRFTYDANGMRTEKIVGDETYGYVWQNSKLIAETYVDETNTRSVYYIYDESGSPIAWSYINEFYYYIKNQQGDILGFTDSEGNVVVTYEYDAWGNLLSYTGTWYLAEYNSLRYRGYEYDVETGLYYLQSRYYDPKVGRFLNADDTDYLGASGTVLGFNLYAYCENNAIMYSDVSGNSIVTGTIFGAILSAVTYYLEWRLNMRKWNTWHFIAYVATGAALGAIGAWLKQVIGLIKLAKLASKLPRLIPIIKKVLGWGVTGIKMGINGYLTGLTRKKGESLPMYAIRVFAIPVS